MSKRSYAILAASLVVAGGSAFVQASTGAFTGPLTNAILSVDLNGGAIASNNATTEGSNGPSASPTVSPDPFGVTWTGWGGPASTNGDGTQLPSSQSSPNINGTTITKTFGAISATVSIPGVALDSSNQYAMVNSTASMNSRDRGSPSGAAGDSDMFRDLLFAGGSGSNVQSTNYLQLALNGLTPNTAYTLAVYSYDSTGNHTTNWTSTAPSISNGISGYWAATPLGNNTFTAPSGGEQSITWTAGTTPAPAIFSLTTDANGSLSVYGWGGDGISGDQSSDTSYIDGFQIAPAPEPASIGILAAGLLGLVRRQRRA